MISLLKRRFPHRHHSSLLKLPIPPTLARQPATQANQTMFMQLDVTMATHQEHAQENKRTKEYDGSNCRAASWAVIIVGSRITFSVVVTAQHNFVPVLPSR